MNYAEKKVTFMALDGKEYKTKEEAVKVSKDHLIFDYMNKNLGPKNRLIRDVFNVSLHWFIKNREQILIALENAEKDL